MTGFLGWRRVDDVRPGAAAYDRLIADPAEPTESTRPPPTASVPSGRIEPALDLLLRLLGPASVGTRGDGPDRIDRSIHQVIEPLLDRYDAGEREALDPSPTVDAALGQLVEAVVGTRPPTANELCHLLDADDELTDRAVTIRRAAGLAETRMEHVHARTVGHGTGPSGASGLASVLGSFPYLDNYRQLVGAEIEAIDGRRSGRRVAFCGAGPLPLSGIVWHRRTGDHVTLIEVDIEAATAASTVIDALDQHHLVDGAALAIQLGNAATTDLTDTDVVIVASLVDMPTVAAIAAMVAAGPGHRLLAVRSALGLSARLTYEPVEVPALEALGLRHLGSVVPANAVVHGPGVEGVTISRSDRRLLTIAPIGVLNTTELFAPAD
ncbi:MAG: nicotianamine synthase family protein [Actinomycetota bacterium]